ncbi:hypothetical protein [Nostoc sp. UHCC 0870]
MVCVLFVGDRFITTISVLFLLYTRYFLQVYTGAIAFKLVTE